MALNKKEQKTVDRVTTARIKAHGGDRSKNLRSIADWIDDWTKEFVTPSGRDVTDGLSSKDVHALRGYAEQLRIIAQENIFYRKGFEEAYRTLHTAIKSHPLSDRISDTGIPHALPRAEAAAKAAEEGRATPESKDRVWNALTALVDAASHDDVQQVGGKPLQDALDVASQAVLLGPGEDAKPVSPTLLTAVRVILPHLQSDLNAHEPWTKEITALEEAVKSCEETERLDGLNACECDSTHKNNNTVCRWCWSKGRRKWDDPEVDAPSAYEVPIKLNQDTGDPIIQTEVVVKISRIRDLLSTALEGGSNYWYEDVRCVQTVGGFKTLSGKELDPFKAGYLKDGTLRPKDVDKAFGPLYVLPFLPGYAIQILASDGKAGARYHTFDLRVATRGLSIMATKYKTHFADFFNENDDATTADVFLQCALFGEIVYS